MASCVLVYLAGKISKNGWREIIVPNIRNVANNAEDVFLAEPTTTIIERLYCVGPYFIGCDHGCYHGEKMHGVAANSKTICEGIGIEAPIVPGLCKRQIDSSNFVFAFIDDPTCYGTLCEIGYAVGRKIPVAVLFANQKLMDDMWFVGEIADIEMVISEGTTMMWKSNTDDPDISMMANRIAYNLAERMSK